MAKIWIWDGTRLIMGQDWNIMQQVVEDVLLGHRHNGEDARKLRHEFLDNVLSNQHHTKFTVTEHDVEERHPLAVLDPLVASIDEVAGLITVHTGIPDAHHSVHIKTLLDHPLTIIPTMDLEHIPNLPTSKTTSGRFPLARLPDGTLNYVLKAKGEDIDPIYGQVDWGELLGKPDTYPPSSHTHLRANITNFWDSPFWTSIPDKPSTYPPSSHTHPADDVVSGILNLLRIPNIDWNRISDNFPKTISSLLSDHTKTVHDDLGLDHAKLSNILPAQHHAVHLKTLDDHPLSIIPTMDDAHIPNVETLSYGGAFAVQQIPNLDAGKITTGNFLIARMPTGGDWNLTSQIAFYRASGEFVIGELGVAPKFSVNHVTGKIVLGSADAGFITSGTFNLARIPNIDWDRISGNFPKTIATLLSDHTKTVHDALGLDHASLSNVLADQHHTKFTITEHDVTARHPLAVLDTLVCSEAEADSKILTHKNITDAHHSVHIKTLNDHPLSIIPTMDLDHLPTIPYTKTNFADQNLLKASSPIFAGITIGDYGLALKATNVPNCDGLDVAGKLVLTKIGTKCTDLGTLWDKTTKILFGDVDFTTLGTYLFKSPSNGCNIVNQAGGAGGATWYWFSHATGGDYPAGMGFWSSGTGYALVITSSGQILFPKTGVEGGIVIGGDTNLYRTAENNLKTDDKLTVAGGVDPPYVSFSGETHDTIRKFADKVEEHEKVMMFWNKDHEQLELYDIKKNKFYKMPLEEVN